MSSAIPEPIELGPVPELMVARPQGDVRMPAGEATSDWPAGEASLSSRLARRLSRLSPLLALLCAPESPGDPFP